MVLPNEFTYVLVSTDANGGEFYNEPNWMLDFSLEAYEVCLIDLTFMPGAWNNVREEGNWIKLKSVVPNMEEKVVFLEPKTNSDRDEFVNAINKLIDHPVIEQLVATLKLLQVFSHYLVSQETLHYQDTYNLNALLNPNIMLTISLDSIVELLK